MACGGADAERCLPPSCLPTSSARLQHAAALGDDRWRDLLDNHDTIVYHEIQRFGGREVNTAGDGFTRRSPVRDGGRHRRRGRRAGYRPIGIHA